MSNSITIRNIAEHNLKGAVLIDGFPGVGLVGTIAVSYTHLTLPTSDLV